MVIFERSPEAPDPHRLSPASVSIARHTFRPYLAANRCMHKGRILIGQS